MSMLTEEEERFIVYWQQNRDKQKKIFRQLLIGLPLGFLFAIPIILNFSTGWDKRASMWARGHSDDNTVTVLIIAVILIAVFVAVFSKKHRWEMYEQQYQELINKKNDTKLKNKADNTTE